jgi:hypothetical protein
VALLFYLVCCKVVPIAIGMLKNPAPIDDRLTIAILLLTTHPPPPVYF